jgi:hypothetical protein
VRIFLIRDRRYDETNWWRSRIGIREVTLGYLRYLHNRMVGRPAPFTPPEWSPESFERRLQAQIPNLRRPVPIPSEPQEAASDSSE